MGTALVAWVGMNYLIWAAVALVAYGLVAPLVSFASEEIPTEAAVVFPNVILVVIAIAIALNQGVDLVGYLDHPRAPYLYAGGLLLGVGITSYYRALSLGPVSSVVPIYGMFIVLASVIGFVVLDEAFSLQKALSILLGIAAIYLASTG